ncbi:MAG: UDP-N-acetylmuramate--L-alanine ligase [Desulfuromonadaceae bacterium]|nr:UDP-N-acetylmuramate--L-alanine ligase [Desulfuromonadaceae bacterium]
MYGRFRRIHLVGIGGIGMSGIADVLLTLGYEVSGSDQRETEITRRLEQYGSTVYYSHRPENVSTAQVVVISSAITPDNPEVVEANRLMIPVIPRAEMLAELMRLKYGIAIAGTHGKTTTTSMVAALLYHAGVDPTAVVGGQVNSMDSSARLGQGDFMVVEADESDGSFLRLSPIIAVVTNIDRDHLDYYADIQAIREVFISFVNKIPFYGLAILCLDDPNIQAMLPQVQKRFVTYGMNRQADYFATDVVHKDGGVEFYANNREGCLGKIRLDMPGQHNVLNALAALAVARELDIDQRTIEAGFRTFAGVKRRFQVKHTDGFMLVDDYGHHPAEIRATLNAARSGWNKRLLVIFQPHRYSRTRALFNDFIPAFNQADLVYIMDVYAAGEEPLEGAQGVDLAHSIAEHGHRGVRYCASVEEVLRHVSEQLKPEDMVLTLGAGSVWQIGERLLEQLKQRP